MSINLNHVTNDISTPGSTPITINGSTLSGSQPSATTAEMTAGTETSARTMAPADIKTAIQSKSNQPLALPHAISISF